MTVYTDFVKAHIGSAPGRTQPEKMRALGAMWRRQKGKSGGTLPHGTSMKGMSGFTASEPALKLGYYDQNPKMRKMYPQKGRGVYRPGAQLKAQKGLNDWSDWGDKTPMDGEGIWDDIKGAAKKVVKQVAPGGVDKLIGVAGKALAGAAGKHLGPAGQALVQKAIDYGGPKLGSLIKGKIEGWGIRHARMHLKHHMSSGMPMKSGRRGGALSGMISAKQRAALGAYIKKGGGAPAHGALSDLLKGLNIKIT